MRKDTVKEKKKEALSQYYSNFSLAILSIGVIAPLFNKTEDVTRLVIGVVFSLIGAGYLFRKALTVLE